MIEFSYSQPILKAKIGFPSPNHTESEDWPQAIIMSSDCIHYYYCGYVEFHENNTEFRVPIIGKVNLLTHQLVWEKEYFCTRGYGSFSGLYETASAIVAIGGNQKIKDDFNSWEMITVMADKENGNALSGYPSCENATDPNMTITFSRLFRTVLLKQQNTVIGTINSGLARSGNNNRAMIVKRLPNGQPDPSFSGDGFFYGPENSEARNVTPIKNVNGTITGYVYAGRIKETNSTDSYDALIGILTADGDLINNIIFSEASPPSGISYTDIGTDQNLHCAINSSTSSENNNEYAYDIAQNEDGGNIVFTAMFDLTEYGGNCGFYHGFYTNCDYVFGTMNSATNLITSLVNVSQCVGSDFQPNLEIKNGKAYFSGGVTDDVNMKGNGILFEVDCNSGALVRSTEYKATDQIYCAFDLTFSCGGDGDIIISGNNNIGDEDHEFYVFSNGCQSNFTFDEPNSRTIFQNEVWNSHKTVGGLITISPNRSLTITNGAIISFGSSWELTDFNVLSTNPSIPPQNFKAPRIRVMPGGTLNVTNQSTLRGLVACGREWMWDGIEVLNGGTVNIDGGSTIQDAKYGILADQGSFNVNGSYNPTESSGGGIINANSSNILNCRRGVHLANGPSNLCNFVSTSFLCTKHLVDPSYRTVAINPANGLPAVTGLGTQQFLSSNTRSGFMVTSCTFSNTANLFRPLKGTGITSYNCGYEVTGSTFNNLLFGMNVSNPTVLDKFVNVHDGNTFMVLNVGIQLSSGQLHKISNNNSFIPESYSVVQPTPNPPKIEHGYGIYNRSSQRYTVQEGNSFSSKPGDLNVFGIVSENSGDAPSLHKSNTFTLLQVGDQPQINNRGLFINCNTFHLQQQAWNVTGNFQDQGACISGPNPLELSYTPDNQFLDGATPFNPDNHIRSTFSFDYWLPTANQSGRPIFNTDPPVVETPTCSQFNPIISGCDLQIPLTPGNVADYRQQYDGMGDGMQKALLGNQLLSYYISNNESENFNNLFSSMTDVSSRRNYALHLLNLGQTAQATIVVNALANTSQEDADFLLVFNILKSLKLDNVGLDGMNPTQQADMYSISDHRNQASYIAQSILEQYYGFTFPLVIDESNAVPITNNSTSRENILIESNNQSLIVSPNPIKDKLNIEIMDENRNIADNYSISLFTLDGKKIIEKSIKSNSCILDMTNFENAIYQIILHKNNEFFGSKRVIKN
ncbi:MAG TPA: hypothetical protein PK622_00225 [Saprospiraceae bacterium]|nr:hypothetical protein [Saprospiraceae bacterium]